MGGRGSSSMSGGSTLNAAIEAYTEGQYSAIRAAARGEEGDWISDEDRAYANALMQAVNAGGTPKDITRTIISDNIPNVGESIDFTLSSASTRKNWATAIAREKIDGMGVNWNSSDARRQLELPVIAYHIANQTKYADVSKKSAYKNQKEVLFSGKYKVSSVTKETVDTGINVGTREIRVTPQQYAKNHNMPISTFTSKKGKTMYQIGKSGEPGSKTYPVGSTIHDGYEPQTLKRDVYHVTLKAR